MCTIIGVGDGEIQSLGELRATWPVLAEDIDDDVALTDDSCLCSVDVEQVMTRAGVTYEWDPFGFQVVGATA